MHSRISLLWDQSLHQHRKQVRREVAAEVGDAYIPPIPNWDSNVITPGTAFMAKLAGSLRGFLHAKIAADPAWQHIQVRRVCLAWQRARLVHKLVHSLRQEPPGCTGGRARLSTEGRYTACATAR